MKYSSLPLERLQPWAYLNNVRLHGVQIQPRIIGKDGADKGGGLVATEHRNPSEPLLTIPPDLILNKSSVSDAARSDKYLREVLDAVGADFAKTPRTIIMVFLLLQYTYANPDLEGKHTGVTTPLTDYVKFLPKHVPLPTLYDAADQELLIGTSLEEALKQKITRLEIEFEHIKASTQHIEWCQNLWWDPEHGVVGLDDWKHIDALCRSRDFELPHGVGESMVPVLDMVNHASDGKHNARFQLDGEGNAELVVRDDVSIKPGDEITIVYGCGGACEMIFSYGFLEHDVQRAREMFLDLTIPNDDPLKRAKIEFAREAPGVRIYTDHQSQIQWESSFVWWACVNEEDGLSFRVLQEVDGSMGLDATWKGSGLNADDLTKTLMEDPFWEIFLLRAIVAIQSRVEMQGVKLSLSQETFDAVLRAGDESPTMDILSRLRDLEMELLATSYQALELEKAHSLESDIVREYLKKLDPDRTEGVEEDFS